MGLTFRTGSASRRGLLSGIAAAPLLALSALDDPRHPDAALIALERRRALAQAEAEAALARLKAICAATVFPDPPEVLFHQERDDALGLSRFAAERWCRRGWYCVGPPGSGYPQEALRRPQMRYERRAPRPEDRLPSYAFAVDDIVPWPEAQARADAIVAAWDHHEAAADHIREASGLNAASADWERFADILADLGAEIRDATARTLDGLRIKARLAQRDLDEDEDPDPTLIAGLVRDILALTGGAA